MGLDGDMNLSFTGSWMLETSDALTISKPIATNSHHEVRSSLRDVVAVTKVTATVSMYKYNQDFSCA